MKRADIIGFLDGDLGNTASEVEKLIIPIINNECDVTIAKFPPAKKKGGLGFVKNLAKNYVYCHTYFYTISKWYFIKYFKNFFFEYSLT